MDHRQIRQAVFDGIMDYYGMDESDDDDQTASSELTDAIMARIDQINIETATQDGDTT